MKKLSEVPFYSLFFALVGIVMMCLGVYRGEMQELFNKAIRICLECIGIG